MKQTYGFKIIEVASHTIGGKYKCESIGNSRCSEITVYSFHAVKVVTTAQGGIALTKGDELAHKTTLMRSHGYPVTPCT